MEIILVTAIATVCSVMTFLLAFKTNYFFLKFLRPSGSTVSSFVAIFTAKSTNNVLIVSTINIISVRIGFSSIRFGGKSVLHGVC